jgi:hypothetical protein
MSNIRSARRVLFETVLTGEGVAPATERQAAFDNAALDGPLKILIDKVARHAFKVTNEDISAVRASGRSEDAVFELVVCAAIGQANRQYEAAIAALDAAVKG